MRPFSAPALPTTAMFDGHIGLEPIPQLWKSHMLTINTNVRYIVGTVGLAPTLSEVSVPCFPC